MTIADFYAQHAEDGRAFLIEPQAPDRLKRRQRWLVKVENRADQVKYLLCDVMKAGISEVQGDLECEALFVLPDAPKPIPLAKQQLSFPSLTSYAEPDTIREDVEASAP